MTLPLNHMKINDHDPHIEENVTLHLLTTETEVWQDIDTVCNFWNNCLPYHHVLCFWKFDNQLDMSYNGELTLMMIISDGGWIKRLEN